MAHLITMDSITFLNKMMKDKHNPDKFNFLVVSKDISTNGDNKNVYVLDKLLPKPQVLTEFIDQGFTKKYAKKYMNQLEEHNNKILLATIAKIVTVEETNVVMLCSEHESQYMYIDLITKYLEKVYGVKSCTYKKFMKNPDKYDNKDISHKKIEKLITKEMESIGVEYDSGKKSKKKDKKKKKKK